AEERRRVLSVFHNRRWDGDFLSVRDVVASGRLGEVMLFEAHWDRFRPTIKRGWREVPGEGAGLLNDLGPHLVDQALALFGPPEAVAGDLAMQRAQANVDDYFRLTLHYGVRRVVLSASTLIADPRPRFAVHATAGSFVKFGLDPQEAALKAGADVLEPGFGEDHPDAWGTLTVGDAPPERVPTRAGRWLEYYEGIAAAVLDGAPAPVYPADAREGLRIIAAARQSADERRLVPL
ncbi:MAG: Gfo/Idh/MocA family oxidoreductase, partial [Pseudomonadota bacterium]|nr:Gfo/Idh/MocA family oxidoreductase [Pseudomonadota bacterium]